VNNKILVVDDDVTSLDIVDLVLEGAGYDVVRATNGQSAVAVAGVQEANPDLIIIDLMMPHMSGQEAVRQIRSKGVQVPIVAFTALDDPSVHQEAREAGCDRVVTKPCKPRDLVKGIKDLLDNS
jgi:two-component system alkaline phosphatase synthesis response regulator PhoP